MSPLQPFALRLRKFVPEGQVRATARRLDPTDPARGKRNLNRWLAGTTVPSKASRDRLAEILGVEREQLALPEDDEEESDLLADLQTALRALGAIERRLSEKVA